MSSRIIAVGASAGGVIALGDLLSYLPADLDAVILVGLHLSSSGPSLLPQVLARRASLPVLAAVAGSEPTPGTVYVAPPDRHLLLVEGRLVLGHGAKENGHRPSHDAMMRSVALAAGPNAIGVVLTGLLDDGSAGLRCIARYGGRCLVQEPAEADFADMPRNALQAVPEAVSGTLKNLAKALVDAVHEPPHVVGEIDPRQHDLDLAELASGVGQTSLLSDGSHPGQPSSFACPDCHGVLNSVPDGDVVRYRCRTGHAWTATSLLAQQRESVETALWIALRSLEERGEMFRRMARHAEQSDQSDQSERSSLAQHHLARSREVEKSATSLRALLNEAVGIPDSPPPDL